MWFLNYRLTTRPLTSTWLGWACVSSLIFQVSCTGLFSGSFLRVEEIQSREVLQTLREKEATISTLKGLFQASISASGLPFSQNLNGVFSYSRPASLHLKGFIRLGVPVMDFHREGNAYELYLPAEGKLITGQVNHAQEPTQWDQTVWLSLRAWDAVLGKMVGTSQSEVQIWKNADQYRIDVLLPASTNEGFQETVLVRRWVDARTLELLSIEYLSSYDEVIVSVECEDYRTVTDKTSQEAPSARLPFSVRAIDHRPSGGSITLQFQEYVMNAV